MSNSRAANKVQVRVWVDRGLRDRTRNKVEQRGSNLTVFVTGKLEELDKEPA